MDEPNQTAAAGLSRRIKRACRAIWIDGLTHEQLGEREGVSKWASMKRIQRARRKLRALGIEPPKHRRPSHRTPVFQLGQIENV